MQLAAVLIDPIERNLGTNERNLGTTEKHPHLSKPNPSRAVRRDELAEGDLARSQCASGMQPVSSLDVRLLFRDVVFGVEDPRRL
jgi:hypothetical protein